MSNDCNGISLSTRSCELTSGKFDSLLLHFLRTDHDRFIFLFACLWKTNFLSLSLSLSLLVPIFFSKSFSSGRHLSPRNSSSLFVPSSFGERMKRKAWSLRFLYSTGSLLDLSQIFFLDSSLGSNSSTQNEHECSFHWKKKKKKTESFHRCERYAFSFSFLFFIRISISSRENCAIP